MQYHTDFNMETNNSCVAFYSMWELFGSAGMYEDHMRAVDRSQASSTIWPSKIYMADIIFADVFNRLLNILWKKLFFYRL